MGRLLAICLLLAVSAEDAPFNATIQQGSENGIALTATDSITSTENAVLDNAGTTQLDSVTETPSSETPYSLLQENKGDSESISSDSNVSTTTQEYRLLVTETHITEDETTSSVSPYHVAEIQSDEGRPETSSRQFHAGDQDFTTETHNNHDVEIYGGEQYPTVSNVEAEAKKPSNLSLEEFRDSDLHDGLVTTTEVDATTNIIVLSPEELTTQQADFVSFDELPDAATDSDFLAQEQFVVGVKELAATVRDTYNENFTVEQRPNETLGDVDRPMADSNLMSNDAAATDWNFGDEGIVLPDFFTLGHSDEHEDTDLVPAPLSESPGNDISRADILERIEDAKDVTSKPTSLAFVFDTTGSMRDDLKQVRHGADGILKILQGSQSIVENYVLVPFKDPDVGPVTVTSDPEKFKESLRNLTISGGGDCPEKSLTAIKQAIIAAKPGASVYVFTDASSNDFYLLPQILGIIQRKHSKVVFVLTGDCGDSDKLSYQAYEKIADISLGQVFHLNKTDVEEVLAYVRTSLGTEQTNKKTQKVDFFSVNKPNASKDEPHNLYIDESVKEFTVSVSGKNPKIELVNPEGEDIKGPPKAKPLLNLENVKVLNVDKPEPGEWTVKVSSDSRHSVRSDGLSEINFLYGFSRLPTDKLEETSHIPLAGTDNYVLIKPTKPKKKINLSMLKLIDMKGNLIQSIPLESVPTKRKLYRGSSPFMPPEEYFYLEINGVDKDGFPIKRITPTAIASQKPDIPVVTMEKEVLAEINKPFTLNCQVESLVRFDLIWFKDELPVKRKEKFEQTAVSSLEIKNVTTQSQGEYKCWAKNIAGSASETTKISVTGPRPIINTEGIAVTSVGKTVEIICTVKSEFPFNQSWVRAGDDSGMLSESTIQHHIEDERIIKMPNGNLKIQQIKQEDQGYYFCVAVNRGGSSYGKTFLKVEDPIVVSVNPKMFELTSSRNIVLECITNKNSRAELIWKKDGKHLDISGKVKVVNVHDFSSLTIENPVKSDEGTYECEGARDDQRDSDISVGKYVEAPVVNAMDKKIVAEVGSNVTFLCLVTGIPTPRVTWMHNGNVLPQSDYKIKSGGTLRIPVVELSDSGNYSCVAENHVGVAKDAFFFEVGASPDLVQPPMDTDVDIGKNVSVPCVATGIPNPTILWRRKDGRPLDKNRITITNTGHLQIQDASILDEAIYICSSENKYGTKESEFKLKISGLIKPIVEDSGEHNMIVPLGQTAELTCQVIVGVPHPTVIWYKDGEVLDDEQRLWEGVILQANNSLIIPYVTHEHKGAYECEARNAAGTSLRHLHLSVTEPPTFKQTGPIEQNVNLGDDVVLPCEVEGDPKPLVYWMKDGMPLQENEQIYKRNEDGALHIKNVDEEYSGTYSCRAVNSAGTAEKQMVMIVKAAPVISAGPASFNAVNGQIVTLTCKATGIPAPAITWYKNEEPLSLYKKDVIYLENNATIRFLVSSSDEGKYKCTAKNDAGQKDRRIKLSVFVPPSIHPPSEELVQSSIGHEVVLNCHVSGSPQPSIIWRRDEEVINNSSSVSISDNGNLHIKNVDLESAGVYACDAENNAGVTQKLFYVIVHAPPQIVDVIPAKIELMAGESYFVPCNAYGSPMPHISWRRNGETVLTTEG